MEKNEQNIKFIKVRQAQREGLPTSYYDKHELQMECKNWEYDYVFMSQWQQILNTQQENKIVDFTAT